MSKMESINTLAILIGILVGLVLFVRFMFYRAQAVAARTGVNPMNSGASFGMGAVLVSAVLLAVIFAGGDAEVQTSWLPYVLAMCVIMVPILVYRMFHNAGMSVGDALFMVAFSAVVAIAIIFLFWMFSSLINGGRKTKK